MKLNKLAETYTGNTAERYDEKRSTSPKWHGENLVIDSLLSKLPAKLRLLDVPVGTGRFIELYKKYRITATGVDISNDMIAVAKNKAAQLEVNIDLQQGSVLDLKFSDGTFDCALCVRLMNWLHSEEMDQAIGQLSRVSKKHLILGIRSYGQSSNFALRILTWFTTHIRQKTPKSSRKWQAIIHDKAKIESSFQKHSLKIIQQQTVPQGRQGTDYIFYLLTKND